MKTHKSIWFGTIGIVIGKDGRTGVLKAYIGKGSGLNRNLDEDFVLRYGMPFPIAAAKVLMPV